MECKAGELLSHHLMLIQNLAFDAKTVKQYDEYLDDEIEKILFRDADESELVQLIQMQEVTRKSLIQMN
tara:strand:- start:15409 stop:15615 length:207 start_codon:yes stop_codon:yes gene_type:complete